MGKKQNQKNFRKKIVKRKKKIIDLQENREKKKNNLIKERRIQNIKRYNLNQKLSNLNRELSGQPNIYKSGSEKSSSNEKNINLRKFKIFALNKIKNEVLKKFKESQNFKESHLLKFLSIYDIDNDINNKYFTLLKESNNNLFQKLIQKYRYTLSYQNALNMGILSKQTIEKEIKIYNLNIKLINENKEISIKEIKSFSKLKFFNLLLELITYELKNIKYLRNSNKELFEKIKSNYLIKEGISFKNPISLGNIELQYYSLIYLYLDYLYEGDLNIALERDYSINKKDNKSIIIPEFIEFNEQKYLEDFNELKKKFIDNQLLIEYEPKNKGKDEVKKFMEKLNTLIIFNEFFQEMIIEERNDKIIIDKSNFILYSLYFGVEENLIKVRNCLFEKDNNFKKNIFPENINYNELCGRNKDIIIKNPEIPFLLDSYFFRYPFILNKNTLKNNEKIFNSFVNFIKYIYTSELMKEIFYNVPEFKGFSYPFEDKDILNELFQNTIFMPYCPSQKLLGYTQKLTAKIYIASNFEKIKYNFSFEELLNFFTNLLITTLHEQFKHYLKMLIYYNSFIYNKNIELMSELNLSTKNEDDIFRNIMKNCQKYNYKNKNTLKLPYEIDGGHKLEILLFGKILGDLFTSASLYIFRYSTWKKPLTEHLDNIMQINSAIDSPLLNKEKENNEILKVKDIKNNKDNCDFISLLLKEYISIKKIEKEEITINLSYSSSRKAINQVQNVDEIKINPNFFTTRNYVGRV